MQKTLQIILSSIIPPCQDGCGWLNSNTIPTIHSGIEFNPHHHTQSDIQRIQAFVFMKKNTNTLCTTTARHSVAIQMANPPMYQGSTIIYERMADLAAAHHAYENGQESYTYGRKGTPTSRMLCEALAETKAGIVHICVHRDWQRCRPRCCRNSP